MDRTRAHVNRFRMPVDGMSCPSCERHVEQALLGAGVSEADADFRRNEAVLNVPGTPDEAALRAAVEAAGYRPGGVEPIGPTPEHLPDQPHYRMAAEGMTCTDCERHVTEALREAGAIDPVANFRRGEARFLAPPSTEPQRLQEAVALAGYKPGPVESLAPERVETATNGRGEGDHYDLAIVGSGGGAFAAAITARRNMPT